jgi:cysteine desulfurase family protein (TIGR01976 family)
MTVTRTPQLELGWIRAQYPALTDDWALFDNAGGSVPLKGVVDRVHDYMSRRQVNLGASYALSAHATALVADGARAMEQLVNADAGEVVLGPSSTMLLRLLAAGLAPRLEPGDEIVVTNLDHESNITPWRELTERGVVVREWRFDPEAAELNAAGLDAVLSNRTRLVCFTQVSNLVGTIHDAAAFVRRIHDAGAMACVDGVAFGPHRRVDVKAIGADFYVLSLYKLSGPHVGLLYARRDRLRETRSLAFSFLGDDLGPYRLQPGNVNHELTASLPALPEYLLALDARLHGADSTADDGARIGRAYDAIAAYEAALSQPVLDFLARRKGVRLLGLADANPARRVPTISFTVKGRDSAEIPAALDAAGVAIRYGDFYSRRAVEALGLLPQHGVARISMVHYNTRAEVDRLLAALDATV